MVKRQSRKQACHGQPQNFLLKSYFTYLWQVINAFSIEEQVKLHYAKYMLTTPGTSLDFKVKFMLALFSAEIGVLLIFYILVDPMAA